MKNKDEVRKMAGSPSRLGTWLSFAAILVWVALLNLTVISRLKDAQLRIGRLEQRCMEVGK